MRFSDVHFLVHLAMCIIGVHDRQFGTPGAPVHVQTHNYHPPVHPPMRYCVR
jgi:hypothetical protein